MPSTLLLALIPLALWGCVEVSSVEGAGDPALSGEGAAGDPNAGTASGPSGDVPPTFGCSFTKGGVHRGLDHSGSGQA